ncbi:Cupin domain-containing protein [Amphibacillus marinus]|uniref:Cupin domain-containing protein n=1 Tax=Amphibacillus marinus TaxID=872970 RepID=A0A1H8LLV9_9BACI|nr:cupin domain-containing protein [Amphibacillus marinus]SEO06069.1 Cupin domain-containing protein [Amphibacillus marinus]
MKNLPIHDIFTFEDVANPLPDQIISTEVFHNAALDITVFSLGAGESISTELVGGQKLIYCLTGRLELKLDRIEKQLRAGQAVILPTQARHAIIAEANVSFQQIHLYKNEEDLYMINKVPHNKVIDLAEQIDIVPNKKASKAIVQRKDLTLTLFALDQGQQIAMHTATGDALVQILEGEAHIIIGENSFIVKEGQAIVMPAEIPHALEATEAFKMLLTVVKGGE